MATYSNRLAVTQVPIRRSFKSNQEDNANASNRGELDIEGEGGYQVRNEDELSQVEQTCLKTLDDGFVALKLFTLSSTSLLKGPKILLKTWPLFFRSKEESGVELQQGLVTLWSNFLIAETLLAAISIQPLVMVPNIAYGLKLKLYKYIWMISMIFDLWGIAVTALFLGYLLGCPNKVVWKWMCKIGWLSRIPSILVLLNTMLTLAATAYTCWILYGYQLGIVCIVVEVFYVVTGLRLAVVLNNTIDEVTDYMQ